MSGSSLLLPVLPQPLSLGQNLILPGDPLNVKTDNSLLTQAGCLTLSVQTAIETAQLASELDVLLRILKFGLAVDWFI